MEIPETGNVYDLPRSARAIAIDDVAERLQESFTAVAYRGGVWGVQTPPRNSEGPTKIVPNSTRL